MSQISSNHRCIIVGGGPAGMMLGYLLARKGVDCLVLEKHADFFRDFRGDTIHPSTLELMHELGVLDEFLELPHQKLHKLWLDLNGKLIPGPDFSHLPTRCKFIALMPQWDFLNFLTRQAENLPAFHLRMKTEVTGLLEENGRVVGVGAQSDGQALEFRADLVVGADGRSSTVRERAGFKPIDEGVPIDVLWFHLKKPSKGVTETLGHIRNGKMLVTIERGDYFQIGQIVRKGTFEEIKSAGLDAFRAGIVATVPEFQECVGELDNWDKVKLLTVQINHIPEWQKPGLLCIGDAAHAMSPAGGVGINLAIQDAVATANLLAEKLKNGACTLDDLKAVQHRRESPARRIQAFQRRIHNRMFRDGAALNIPFPVRKLLALFAPIIRRVAARIVGMGFQPEHIE